MNASILAASMTFDALINETFGHGLPPWEGMVPAQPLYNLPHMADQDGPQGVGGGLKGVTAFPSAMGLAQTWDADLASAWGLAIGTVHRA